MVPPPLSEMLLKQYVPPSSVAVVLLFETVSTPVLET